MTQQQGQMFNDDMPLGEAKAQYSFVLQEGGICPCCDRFGKYYRWSISPAMILGLIGLQKEYGTEYGDLQAVKQLRGVTTDKKEAHLRFWNLIEPKEGVRKIPGLWRSSHLGLDFTSNEATVPKYVWVYNKNRIGFDGEEVGIFDIITEGQMKEALL